MTLEQLEREYAANLVRCFDFSVPVGWLPLVTRLLERLTEVQPYIDIAQVKAKCGLTVYTDNATDAAQWLIDKAFRASQHICQGCGEPGKLSGFNVWCASCGVRR